MKVYDQALVALAERVLDQKLSTAYALASAACPNDEQQKGIDNLWMRIGGSSGTTHYLASCIAKAITSRGTWRTIVTSDLEQKVIDLAGLALRLGGIDRTACWHPDGDQRESVADHTVMLGWIAPALADSLYHDLLSPPLVATLALVHDMVEVYAGDTPTLRITAKKQAAKEAREMLAKDRLTREFVEALPWIPAMIDLYERQYIPEARFVRAVDKMLPKLVHLLDGAKGLIEEKMTVAELDQVFTKQAADMQLYAGEFPELLALRAHLVTRVTEMLRSLTEFGRGSTVPELIDSDTDIS